MQRRMVILVLTALLPLAVLVVGSSAGTASTTVRVLDRTFRCTPSLVDGALRATDFTTVPSGAVAPLNELQNPSPGFLGVSSGGRTADGELLSIRARGWQRFRSAYSREGVYVRAARCVPSHAAVVLSARNLPAGPVRWATESTCVERGRVLVRVRATLGTAAKWQRQEGAFVGARAKVVGATVAVRNERTGKPLAYLELDKAGKTKLWSASRCG